MSKIPEKCFWQGNSDLQELYRTLNQLIPDAGPVENPRKNRKLEKMRKAANCYYDLYNNGLCNRAAEFREVFNLASSAFRRHPSFKGFREAIYTETERRMEEIVLAAGVEQGLVARPVTG